MNLFCAVSPWVEKAFPIIERICLALLAVLCLVMIVLVFMQITDGNGGTNSITGNQDSYYSHNKSGSREGRITKWIIVCLCLIAALTIAYFILIKFA